MTEAERIIVALDVSEPGEALWLAESLSQAGVGAFKVGLELFSAGGPEVVRRLVFRGWRVFLDLKYHDITATVERTVKHAVNLGVWMFNVHALGGKDMMRRAAEAAREAAETRGAKPLVLGVTLLTNLDAGVLQDELGIREDVETFTMRLARLAHEAGLEGVVCSPHEVRAIKAACGDGFLTVTPGVRPHWSGLDDQKRVLTPVEAVRSGADFLVIGRPMTRAADPAAAARRIIAEVQGEVQNET